MRIAITGAHGVGKTTLTNLVQQSTVFVAPVPTPMHNPQPGRLKSLQDCSNEEVLRLSQRRYTERIRQEHRAPMVVSDGSVLHEWVYASTRLQYGSFPASEDIASVTTAVRVQLKLVEDFIEEALIYADAVYDELFFIPVEFDLPEDPPISSRFQCEASDHLYELLKTLDRPVRIVRGTLEQRLHQVLSVLGPEHPVSPEALASRGLGSMNEATPVGCGR